MSETATAFLLSAGILVVVTLLLLLRPWQASGQRLGRKSAIACMVLLPSAALVLYFMWGTPAALIAKPAVSVDSTDIEQMVARLEARLKQNPDNPEGWQMLARSYAVLGRPAEAAQAFARIARQIDNNPSLLANYAEALALSRDGNMQGEPQRLVLRALQLQATHPHALFLAGSAAFDRRDYRGAIAYWQKLLQQLPPDSEDARIIRARIARAQEHS